MNLTRRMFLTSSAAAILAAGRAHGTTYGGFGLPWTSGQVSPPAVVEPEGWRFFTDVEARLVEAIVERLIPADDLSVSGKDAGCAVYIDRQLAGPYGADADRYTQGPFREGLPTQGRQTPETPAEQYRAALAAIDAHCQQTHGGRIFAELPDHERDGLLGQLERGEVPLDGPISAKDFFDLILEHTREGFFADPVHGGNRDLVSWTMIGFPGARYDFRDHVLKHNVAYTLPPMGLLGRAAAGGRS